MTGLLIALRFLTRLPVPNFKGEEAGDLARAAPWLPVVGAMLGILVALAVALGVNGGPWVAALAGLLAWVLLTGGLHLEGLADVADGLGAAHRDKDRFLEVARDPHVGAFGVIAIALQIAVKLVLLAWVADSDRVPLASVVLIAAWARWGTLVVGRFVPPLRPEGMASRLAAGIGMPAIGIGAVVLAALSYVVAPALMAAVPMAALLALYWRVRLGGINGDCHGADIELMESLLLFALLLA